MSDSVRPHRLQPTRLHGPWDSPGKNTGVGCHFLLQCMKVKSETKSLSRVRLLATPWTAAYQAPLSMGFSRQEYWSGVPSSSPSNEIKSGFLPQQHLIFHRPQFSSVQFSHSVVSDSLQPNELQHARPPCPSPTPRVHSNSCALSR